MKGNKMKGLIDTSDIQHSYWKLNGLMKRLNNFFTYLFAALASILIPVAVDNSMYLVLYKQFDGKNPIKEMDL